MNDIEREKLRNLLNRQQIDDLCPADVQELRALKAKVNIGEWPDVNDPSCIAAAASIAMHAIVIAPTRVRVMIHLHLIAAEAENAGIPIEEVQAQLGACLKRQQEGIARHKALLAEECPVPGCMYHHMEEKPAPTPEAPPAGGVLN